jgi:flagellar protein FliT
MQREPVIVLYEAVGLITERMLTAAQHGNWELLEALEHECAAQVATLAAIAPGAPLSGAGRAHKLKLLQRIMTADRELRVIVEPWMAKLAACMQRGGPERGAAALYARP